VGKINCKCITFDNCGQVKCEYAYLKLCESCVCYHSKPHKFEVEYCTQTACDKFKPVKKSEWRRIEL
jgi:hypothetical protein